MNVSTDTNWNVDTREVPPLKDTEAVRFAWVMSKALEVVCTPTPVVDQPVTERLCVRLKCPWKIAEEVKGPLHTTSMTNRPASIAAVAVPVENAHTAVSAVVPPFVPMRKVKVEAAVPAPVLEAENKKRNRLPILIFDGGMVIVDPVRIVSTAAVGDWEVVDELLGLVYALEGFNAPVTS